MQLKLYKHILFYWVYSWLRIGTLRIGDFKSRLLVTKENPMAADFDL